jgi:hypothetical protein
MTGHFLHQRPMQIGDPRIEPIEPVMSATVGPRIEH